jgi:hypothetical protein
VVSVPYACIVQINDWYRTMLFVALHLFLNHTARVCRGGDAGKIPQARYWTKQQLNISLKLKGEFTHVNRLLQSGGNYKAWSFYNLKIESSITVGESAIACHRAFVCKLRAHYGTKLRKYYKSISEVQYTRTFWNVRSSGMLCSVDW